VGRYNFTLGVSGMCGINGVFAYHYAANAVDHAELVRTRDHMAARGPDAAGAWISEDGRIGFGHRRLSIIDLSDAGAQPMLSPDGRYAVTFNGEIYNYRELRLGLEAQGHVFRSHSDTEVLLHLYAKKGADMVYDLRGMFAFAIWDSYRRTLFLARDPYGIKPLYYADDGWTFRFASQVKALVAGGSISRDPEPAGLVGFYLFGHVPEPFTVNREVRALPAGTSLFANRIGGHEPRRYHRMAQVYCDAVGRAREGALRQEQAQGELHEALLDSVRHHVVADVPVGAFLSGGIDSSSLVSLMRQAGQRDIQTVTLAFREFDRRAEDEAPLAATVARLYETQHTERVVTQSEFAADLPRILEAMDQPSIDGINSWFVAKAAHELGLKVAVSGVGGDELFGGYPSFKDIPRWVGYFGIPGQVPLLGKLSRVAVQMLTSALNFSPKAAGLVELGGTYAGAYFLRRGLFMPWELGKFLDRDIIAKGWQRLKLWKLINSELTPGPVTPFARVSVLESAFYMRNQLLRDVDWASMAHSLEVRVPLVDSVLLSKVASSVLASPAWGKQCLAATASPALPKDVLHRSKAGFATPVAEWQRTMPLPHAAPTKLAPISPWARNWALNIMAA
jgi:asparagine synthase (glutamine-hydrolysing)